MSRAYCVVAFAIALVVFGVVTDVWIFPEDDEILAAHDSYADHSRHYPAPRACHTRQSGGLSHVG